MAYSTGIPVDSSKLQDLNEKISSLGIKYLIPSYVDIHGIPKAKMVPSAFIEKMLSGSELFTGAALDGVPQNMADHEVASVPDPDSFMPVPWREDCGWFASDLWYKDAPFEACSRGILKRVLKQAEQMGYQANCGIEAEFYVFKDGAADQLQPISAKPNLTKPAYDAVRLMDNLDSWLSETVDAMNGLGWGVYSFDHEDGIGQFEIDFDYSSALTMADRFVFLRVMTNEIAGRHGAFSSYMPKPYADKAGSGAHLNMSLADIETGRNVFEASGGDRHKLGLSPVAYTFIAGVMKHMPAILALNASTVNSYKRLIVKGSTSGFTWAPTFTSWGGNNRSNTLRVPPGGGRVELRAADSALNPYLGMAMMIAAGLEGIADGLDPQEPNDVNLFEQSEQYRSERGIAWLPRTLDEAISALEADELAHTVLGEKMMSTWVEFKRQEWTDYINHVSDWELQRYLKQF